MSIRPASLPHLGSVTTCAALAAIVSCTYSEPEESTVSRASMALTTNTTVSFQEGTSGYLGTTDTYISEYASSTNYGAVSTLLADGSDPNSRDLYALIRWDLSSIPANATVTAVTLTFRVTNGSYNSYPIYALNRGFDESTATWVLASSGTNWSTSGAKGAADRNATSVGSLNARTTGSFSVTLNATGIAIVNGWVASPASNSGFILASTSNADGIDLASSEHSTVSYRPQITIAYSVTTPDETGGTTGAGGVSSGGTAPTGGFATTSESSAGAGGAAGSNTSVIGGSSAEGGTTSTGGTTAEGGTTGEGGTVTGGTTSEGGMSAGGTSADGGVTSSGGTTAEGGVTSTSAGGTTAEGGTTGEGGATSTGGTTTAGTSSGGSATSFGFFVYSDSHVTSTNTVHFTTGLTTMAAVQAASPVPTIAAISLGDHTDVASSAQWASHMQIATTLLDPTATTFDGPKPRYLAGIGNHDIIDSNWYNLWNANFSGQQQLGTNSQTGGIYFAFDYGNALFVIRDTNRAMNSSTRDPQAQDLFDTLSQSTQTFKFVFYHKPAYYCGYGGEGRNAASLALLDAAARNNADIVFNGHSHVYSRTCRMTANHACTGSTAGAVQLEVGSIGTSSTRSLRTPAQTLVAYDYDGQLRSYGYTCSTATAYDKVLGSTRTFTYVRIEGCTATISTYPIASTTPIDSWSISHCQ